ncbi:Dabb family protein [Bacteroidota bacterium]
MIRHVVMFKLKDMADNVALEAAKKEVKNRLEALPGKIDVIRSMEVGINIVKSDRAFDVALVSSFENLDDLETYRVHPAHQEVVEYIAGVKDKSASADFVI